MRRRSNLLVALIGVVALGATPVAQADQQKCESSQLSAIGSYSKDLYKCLSKSAKKSTDPIPCLTNAAGKLTKSLTKIDEKAGCEIDTDLQPLDLGLQSGITRDTDEVLQILNDSSSSTECAADQLKALGRYSKKLYSCLSTAVKKNEGAGACYANASNGLTKKLRKTDDKVGCDIDDGVQALDLELQTTMSEDTNDVQQSLKQSSAFIEQCEAGYADVWQIQLLDEDEFRAQVDSIDNPFYFDPGLSITGVTNNDCIAFDTSKSQLKEFDVECTYDPQGVTTSPPTCVLGDNAGVECEDEPDPETFCETTTGKGDGMCLSSGACPGLTITAGAEQQICELTVFVEGSCEDQPEDVDDDTRGDYQIEFFVNGRTAVGERVESNVDLNPAP